MDVTTKAELLDELIADCEERIDSLRAEIALEDRYLRDLRAKRTGLNGAGNTGKPERSSDLSISASQTLPEVITAVLTNAGKAMRARDIAKILTQSGYGKATKSGLLPSVLSALARRDDLFKKVKRGTYRLKSEQTER